MIPVVELRTRRDYALLAALFVGQAVYFYEAEEKGICFGFEGQTRYCVQLAVAFAHVVMFRVAVCCAGCWVAAYAIIAACCLRHHCWLRRVAGTKKNLTWFNNYLVLVCENGKDVTTAGQVGRSVATWAVSCSPVPAELCLLFLLLAFPSKFML